jgi:hypothetical protein
MNNLPNLGISPTPKVRGGPTMQERIIQPYSDLKRDEWIREYFGNETRCVICGNNFFKVERISPERIMLICENCKETHLICAEIYGEDRLRARSLLSFLCPETEIKK